MNCTNYYDKVGYTGLGPADKTRFEKTFSHLLKSGSLFDVGCGEGYWLRHVSERSRLSLFGADVSPVRAGIAKKNLEKGHASLSVADARSLPLEDNAVNQITALEVLEHIPEWQNALMEMIRVASDRVVITVPYHEMLLYEKCVDCNVKAYLHGHLHSFTESDFRSMDIEGNMTFQRLHGLGLDHYVKRAINGVARKAKSFVVDESGHSSTTVCPRCYQEVPYTKYFERATRRILKILTRSPQYILVQIDN